MLSNLVLGITVLVACLIAVANIFQKKDKERFHLAHTSRRQPTVAEKAWRQEAGICKWEMRTMNSDVQPLSPFDLAQKHNP